ncbi:hypothetical protein AQUCO_01500239v1 [Aquilegia coerulea]|uniref:Uncharacterized protein n=1 Tax=Aquilegia coerulea TaxID=218851 RepID=A0A2G5DSR0_AQUCA|nr:hypothetical protein AQUCO_01500239v1 [Aquilegia coerulea]
MIVLRPTPWSVAKPHVSLLGTPLSRLPSPPVAIPSIMPPAISSSELTSGNCCSVFSVSPFGQSILDWPYLSDPRSECQSVFYVG